MATSKGLKKSKAANSSDRRRPFARNILERAGKLALHYQVVVWHDDDEGRYYGRGIELPLAMGDGKSPDECVKSTREAFLSVVATMIESGQSPPAPAMGIHREHQIQLRLSTNERLAIETAARQQGFTGISDFVRAAALAGAKVYAATG